MFRGFSNGISSLFEAIGFIFKHNLWYFFIFPIIISILIMSISWIAGMALIETVMEWLEMKILGSYYSENPEMKMPEFGWDWFVYIWEQSKSAFSNGLYWVIAIALKVIFFFISSFFLKYIVLAFMSPILAWLSEKTEHKLTGNEYPFKIDQFVRDVWRGILISIRNFTIEIFLMILIWSFFFVLGLFFPPISFLAIPCLFLLSSYYYGYAMIDYVNERRKLKISEGSKFVRKYSGMAIALGMFVAVIPEISFWLIQFFASFFISTAAIVSAVAAVIAVNKEIGLVHNRKKELPEWK